MNWDDIESRMVPAVMRAFDDFVAANDTEGLYALCLSVSEDGMGIGLNANTETCFNKKLSSESDIEEITPQYQSYLRWAPAEWCFEGVGNALFQSINDDLSKVVLNEGIDETGFVNLINVMTKSLRSLRHGRGGILENVTLFITVTDSDQATEIENISAKELNPLDIEQLFASRFE